MAAAQVALQFQLRGYNSTIVTACAAGTQAIGERAMLIRHGRRRSYWRAVRSGDQRTGMAGFSSCGRFRAAPTDPAKGEPALRREPGRVRAL